VPFFLNSVNIFEILQKKMLYYSGLITAAD